jgi:signal transduction histidine kinase
VLLSRLRIRGKLTLLVMIPLLAMVGLVLPVVRDLVTNASKATDVDAAATVAGRVGPLLQDLQHERLLSVGYLLGVVDEDDLVLQTASVVDRVRDVRRDLGSNLPSEVRAGIDQTEKLNALRQRVRSKTVTPEQVLDGFAPMLDGMIDSLRLERHADADTAAGRQLIALDALLRLDESNTESTALLAMMAGGDVVHQSVRYREEGAEYDIYLGRFAGFATQRQRELYDLVAAAFRNRVGGDFDVKFEADPAKTMAALPIAKLFPALQSFSVLGGFVEKRLVDDVTSLVAQQRRQQFILAYGIGALALAVLIAVLILVAAVARAVAVPLTRLSRSAAQVADAGETELRRVADDESETIEPVHLEVLDVNSRDEIGDLARVFERVQSTASQLVERQVLSRRNVAEMFGHIGRRTQNLVGGQVSLIDELENEETDPERLAKLYRLDHISNRLRRSADSLVVISGADREARYLSPVRLVDVVRLALAEIEEYTRVDVDIPLDLSMAPAVVSDMVLMCGELLENATNFSPPHTRVTVSARAVPGGTRLVVTDHGIGMPDERLAEENTRIARRERLDLVPTQVLGLFVVGRLARRHSLAVALSHTPGGGVTVDVNIDGALLADERVLASVTPVVPAAEPEPRPIAGERSPSPWDSAEPAAAALIQYRSAPEPAPRRLEERRTNGRDVLWRVNDAMQDQLTWNAFEVVRRLHTAPPHQDAPGAAATFRELPVAPWTLSPVPAQMPSPPVPTSASGLRQRVRGAQLPVVATAAVSDQVPAVADAVAAKEYVEAFESGVRRAQDAAAAPVALSHVTPSPPSDVRPDDRAEVRSLNRRVPGATLPLHESSPRRAVGPPVVKQDPEEVRSLVEQFESGVARALHDTSQRNQK